MIVTKGSPLEDKLEILLNAGYMVNISVMFSNVIVITGYEGKSYKAKNKAANTITHLLNCLPYIITSWNRLNTTGYYSFYCK